MAKKSSGGVRLKKPATPVPNDLTEVEKYMAEIADLDDKFKLIDARLDKKKLRLQTRANAQLEPLKLRGKQLFEGIAAFAESRRGELTTEERKSVALAIGTLGWRLNPPYVEFDTDDDTMVARLEKLGLDKFIRIRKEPNREAMLEHRDEAEQVSGVSFEQDEDFYVKIKKGETEVEKKKKVSKKKKKTKK